MLDDLIGRQRLEDLADLAKSLTDTYKRLQDLLARYQATKDEALRRQLEREIRDLKSRIQQLAQKIAALKARNEVATEWQNLPDLKKAAEQANQFSNLLEKGDPSSLQKALSELGGALSEVRKMLENNAESFGESRFQQENKTHVRDPAQAGRPGGRRALGGRRQRRAGAGDGREAGQGDGRRRWTSSWPRPGRSWRRCAAAWAPPPRASWARTAPTS